MLAGRRPRVGVPAGQFPAGTSGTVVRVGDPDTDGPDYITVRVKVGRVVDELGFSPKELSKGGRRAAAPPPAPPVAPAAPARTRRSTGSTRSQPNANREPAAAKAPNRRGPSARPARRGGPAPAVTVTIASSGASWSVSAQRGNRAVLKKAPVAPGVVAAIASLLAQPAVDEAVAAVNDGGRLAAEERAAKLRAELAEVEAVLSSHRRP